MNPKAAEPPEARVVAQAGRTQLGPTFHEYPPPECGLTLVHASWTAVTAKGAWLCSSQSHCLEEPSASFQLLVTEQPTTTAERVKGKEGEGGE